MNDSIPNAIITDKATQGATQPMPISFTVTGTFNVSISTIPISIVLTPTPGSILDTDGTLRLADNLPEGTLIGQLVVTMSNGQPFTGTYGPMTPSEFSVDAAGQVSLNRALTQADDGNFQLKFSASV